MTDQFRADVTRLIAALRDVAVDRAPVNFLGQRTMADAYDTAALDRLRSIKRERDPQDVIRGNRPVLP